MNEEDETPPVSIADGYEGNCESCSLPIRSGECIHEYEDAVVHVECPKRAQA